MAGPRRTRTGFLRGVAALIHLFRHTLLDARTRPGRDPSAIACDAADAPHGVESVACDAADAPREVESVACDVADERCDAADEVVMLPTRGCGPVGGRP
ncbi:hypothetical protein L3i22_091970 [Actinoplanes sp. L3-i22]|nr:hypothetical protein L3i22_091970 [Actinoplanes sp. L3-i22]